MASPLHTYSISSDAKKYVNEINLSTDNISENSSSTGKAKQIKTQAKIKNINELKDKPLHSKYPIRASDTDVNSSLTHHWLASLDMKAETEGFILAALDQSLSTKNFQANILENGADTKYKVCDKHTETIDHFVSSYPMLAPTEYLNRHDRLSQCIYCCLRKNFCLPHERNWWNINQQKSLKTKKLLFYTISTSRTIQENRPDTVVKIKMIKFVYSLICLVCA